MVENIKKLLQDSKVRSALGTKLWARFNRNKALRRQFEIEWQQSIRQIKGIYDSSVDIPKDQSHVYPKMTRKYCRMVEARIIEMLFPEGDRNWDMEPTPEPRIGRIVVNTIAQALGAQKETQYQAMVQQAQQAGQDPSQIPQPQITQDEMRLAINEFCKITNQKMRDLIDDQLTEIKYTEEAKRVIRSGVEYGTGVMKGPLVETRKLRTWKQNEGSGEWDEFVEKRELPLLKNVRIWDWYPDLSVTELYQTIGNFERHVKTKRDLNALAKLKGFDAEFIQKHIVSAPNGDAKYENWETELQSIEAMANAANTGEVYKSESGDTQEGNPSSLLEKRYELFEYWGTLDAQDLVEAGIQIPEEERNFVIEVNAWGLGKNIVKISIVEGASTMYKLFYFEKDETSLYGCGLPRVMRHSQDAISAAARMILDNGAVCAGPQMEINHSFLMPGQNITSFHPRKIWWREGRGIESQWAAIKPIQFDSHITELKMIMDVFRQIADEETCLPTWMISSPANTNETAQGSSMRWGMLLMSVKDIVRNFDVFTEEVIGAVYQWNMDFSPREDIKGDYTVKARGISSLVGKEARMQALAQMRGVLEPEDWDYIPRRDFLVEFLKTHDIAINIRSEEEARAYRQSKADPELPILAKEMQKAEIEYRNAQALSMLSGAKKKNADAEKVISSDDEVDKRLKMSQARMNDTKSAMMPLETIDKIRKGAKEANAKPTTGRPKTPSKAKGVRR